MILATRRTFIVEKSWKNMYFHPKLAWPPITYDVISRKQLTITKLVSKSARGMNEQLQKTSGLMFYPLGKKLRKTLWRGGKVASTPYSPCTPEGQLYRPYSISFNSSNVGKFFYSWMLKDCIEDQRKKAVMFTSSTKREIKSFTSD